MEYYPPSLDRVVLKRSWRAANGERGVLPKDAGAFLDACERDNIKVFGWEVWLIDHHWDGKDGAESSTGVWTGLIPDVHGGTCVWRGDGDAAAIRKEVETLDWKQRIPPDLHPFVRFNFTVDL